MIKVKKMAKMRMMMRIIPKIKIKNPLLEKSGFFLSFIFLERSR